MGLAAGGSANASGPDSWWPQSPEKPTCPGLWTASLELVDPSPATHIPREVSVQDRTANEQGA